MSFDDWRERYDIAYAAKFKNPPFYSRSELYFMEQAYIAGMERAAVIVIELYGPYGSLEHLRSIADEIRKEIDNE